MKMIAPSIALGAELKKRMDAAQADMRKQMAS
jgi:hypothetical protein